MRRYTRYMPNEIKRIKEEVIKKEKPSKEDYELANSIFQMIKRNLERELRRCGVKAEVIMVGSIAKDTWLKSDKDLDIFVCFSPEVGKEFIKKRGVDIIRRSAPKPYEEHYAEHPYVRAKVKGFEVDIVPCFKVRSPREIISAVDRTPFHTEYILKNMKDYQKDEVRVLKRFLKGIGAYGAEIKIEGFSGYLVELLILEYGTFDNCLKNVSEWRPWKTVIDIEGYYSDPQRALKKFNSPLIVIDPVDPERNAAAAVSLGKMTEFIAASRLFLRRPSLKFFYPPDIRPITSEELKAKLRRRGTDILVIKFKPPQLPPDILWGQLKRSIKGIVKFLGVWDFSVLDYATWSNERDKAMFMLELERAKLPHMKKHIGPPVTNIVHEERFLNKYLKAIMSGRQAVMAGPRIEDGRWVVYIKRKYDSVKELLKERIQEAGLSKDIALALSKNMEVLVNEEVCKLLSDLELNKALAEFLLKRPRWLMALSDGE